VKAILVVQDNSQEGFVDVDLAVVLNEAQFPEFIHEKIDPRSCCACPSPKFYPRRKWQDSLFATA
jgi:hypothetical protein